MTVRSLVVRLGKALTMDKRRSYNGDAKPNSSRRRFVFIARHYFLNLSLTLDAVGCDILTPQPDRVIYWLSGKVSLIEA